ncbi:alkyl/aryl-sulfatase [Mycobacteroides franklinii]|uniref:Linear primary-alkylsulfatase n=1 Tax=Mycobacteroides franklinii TaxID=948102 RepID=A0A4R8RFU1_9MYCO|nr:alkyl sulfatase dimerization domain-containing protein [Mycobacteroides franklinii]TDZ41939.1 Metallo-beta-lactamase superfamily protein [Mycobacteroides franklinii]TDZ52087.1 Metallo-beta-lactamase superfamily protein [Mycobacteroides franklinii]TDZ55494.1 Metallo-beta-lactamase superfamily protein [Mycobacteroides franklinii]TDZ62435.1 Metallo-beta-lactamase superfamily protein [Mycobacteroides franklinii]TDZ68832.1 Metallo-beta-lactamase superfamily protein [Mycobacteroides franklinii]
MPEQTQPTSRIIDQNAAAAQELPFASTVDQADADRGFIAALEPGVVTDAAGKTVWDNDSYSFLGDSCPASVHPSLWRQCGLNIRQGLYLVTEGIYQVRGLDISNMTIVEGENGVIVIDPLVSAETAAAALALYRSHRGDRPVTGLIYTHSHADHFGGALGVVSTEDVAAGRCPVLAPAGFLEHAVAENVYAGTAMTRRAVYMYGAVLPRGPLGQVGSGLGQTNSIGTVTLIPPTLDITHTGQEETIDGVRMIFQLTPGTEAPAEMNFHFPQHRALCMAENATHTLHNLLTLRGALVRDPHVWARYITEAINLYAHDADVVFASHHWPTWDTARLVEYLSLQRDLYAYLHDQTLRQLNQGFVGSEIAETLQLPPAIAGAWHARGYYGSISHNVKAIYQRYMGWFDGNPAHLWEHPPVANAQRHVEFMGGSEEVLRKAHIAFEEGDYRWVAQVVNYVIFADPANEAAKMLQASCFEQLGYGAENATWRNFYLMGAYELRHGNVGTPMAVGSPTMMAALTVDQVFDALSLRINGPKAWNERFVSDWTFTDEDRVHRVELRNGVLVHYDRPAGISPPDVTFTLTRPTLIDVLLDGKDPAQLVASGEIAVEGDLTGLARLVAVLDAPDPGFAIVTP